MERCHAGTLSRRDHRAVPVALPPPVLVTPSANEVSFGRFAGRVGRGTQMIVVSIDGRVAAKKDIRPGRTTFDFNVALPQRDVQLTVTAIADGNRRSSTTVAPVFGLPRGGSPRAPPRRSYEDRRLARTIRALAGGFPGTCAIFVQDLRTGGGAAWNARAAFPAASTLKVGIAIEVLRALRGKPLRGSRVDRLLRKMIVPSDDKAANELLIWLGGSIERWVGSGQRDVSGVGPHRLGHVRRLRASEPDADPGPAGTANRASSASGPRPGTSRGSSATCISLQSDEGRWPGAPRRLRASEARYLLYLLAQPRNRAGWPTTSADALRARQGRLDHESPPRRRVGLREGGAFLAVVMTWNGRGVGSRRMSSPAASRARRSRASAAGSGEVLVVGRRPTAAPRPADRREGPDEHAALDRHPRLARDRSR